MVKAEDPATHEIVEKEVLWLNTGNSRHICLGNHNSPVGKEVNPWMFALLKIWLRSLFVPVKRDYSVMNLIINHSNQVINGYLNDPGEITYDPSIKRIVMLDNNKRDRPSHKHGILNSYGFYFVEQDFTPDVDIISTEEGCYIYIDVPQVTGKYKLVKVGRSILRVTGVRERPYDQSKTAVHTSDRTYGEFKKEFTVQDYDIKGIKHDYVDGVIKIFLPVSAHEVDL